MPGLLGSPGSLCMSLAYYPALYATTSPAVMWGGFGSKGARCFDPRRGKLFLKQGEAVPLHHPKLVGSTCDEERIARLLPPRSNEYVSCREQNPDSLGNKRVRTGYGIVRLGRITCVAFAP
jgi:hypothetical protein